MTTTASPRDPRVESRARDLSRDPHWFKDVDRGIKAEQARTVEEERIKSLVAWEAEAKAATPPPIQDFPERPTAPILARETIRDIPSPVTLDPMLNTGSCWDQVLDVFRTARKAREAAALRKAWAEALRSDLYTQGRGGEYRTNVLNSEHPDLCAVEVAAVALEVEEAALREALGHRIVDAALDAHDEGVPFSRIAEQVAESAPTWAWWRGSGEDNTLPQNAPGAVSATTVEPATVRWMGQHVTPEERAVNTAPVLAKDTLGRDAADLAATAPSSVERPAFESVLARENQGPVDRNWAGPGTGYRLVADTNGHLVDQPVREVTGAPIELSLLPEPALEPAKEEVVERIVARGEPVELSAVAPPVIEVNNLDSTRLAASRDNSKDWETQRWGARLGNQDYSGSFLVPRGEKFVGTMGDGFVDILTGMRIGGATESDIARHVENNRTDWTREPDVVPERGETDLSLAPPLPSCEFDHALTDGIDTGAVSLVPEKETWTSAPPESIELEALDSTLDTVAPPSTGGDATKLWVKGLRENTGKQLRGDWREGEDRCGVYQGVMSTGLSVGQMEEAYGDLVPDVMERNDLGGESFDQLADHIERTAPAVGLDGATR